jgi:hypothetical protein
LIARRRRANLLEKTFPRRRGLSTLVAPQLSYRHQVYRDRWSRLYKRLIASKLLQEPHVVLEQAADVVDVVALHAEAFDS